MLVFSALCVQVAATITAATKIIKSGGFKVELVSNGKKQEVTLPTTTSFESEIVTITVSTPTDPPPKVPKVSRLRLRRTRGHAPRVHARSTWRVQRGCGVDIVVGVRRHAQARAADAPTTLNPPPLVAVCSPQLRVFACAPLSPCRTQAAAGRTAPFFGLAAAGVALFCACFLA